jgi:hypothetical protein
MVKDQNTSGTTQGQKPFSAPSISLPKGGGAIRGIGKKFADGEPSLPVGVQLDLCERAAIFIQID